MSIKSLAAYALPTSKEIPENKVSWPFEPNKSALLIHDMQQYFVEFYGQNNALIDQVVKHIAELKQYCKANNIPVYYTAQPQQQPESDRALLNDMWGKGLPAHPEKQPIIDALYPDQDDIVLTKWRYSAFYRSPLKEMMDNSSRDQLLICGIYGHIGVMQTGVDAFMNDIKPFLVADGIADFSREDHLLALNYIARNAGRVVSKDHLINTLAGSEHKESFSKSSLRAQIAPFIEDADELQDDDNLMDFGLDSVAVMTLISKWQQQGINTNFVDLAKTPSVDGFWKVISQSSGIKEQA
ncbi:isochorismatase family protein [Psychromonas arctica]|uniref:isochorismatase family protein n=1 Tax=Psychromonas arctica TaxID=168275 RepID=UPI002FD283AC